MSFKGIGCGQDYKQAKYYFELAGNNPIAENNLGYLYQHGLGVTQNHAKAFGLYQRAAQKLQDGRYNLAWMWETGAGVEKDLEKAKQLY